MAKISVVQTVSELEKLVVANDKSLQNLNNTPLVQFVGTTPIFVTYYSQDKSVSTSAIGFHDESSKVGKNSPIRYNEIKHLPIFLDNALSRDKELEKEYTGITESGKGSALLLPNTVDATEWDLIKIKFANDQESLFKVTNVVLSTFKNNPYTAIEFELYKAPALGFIPKEDQTYITDEQIVGRWTCIYSNIGTEYKAILKDDVVLFLEKLKRMVAELNNAYLCRFMNDKSVPNVFMFNKHCNYKNKLMSKALNEFIIDNNVFRDRKGRDMYLVDESAPLPCFNKSIYDYIIEGELPKFQKNQHVIGGIEYSSFSPLRASLIPIDVMMDDVSSGTYLGYVGEFDYINKKMLDILNKEKQDVEPAKKPKELEDMSDMELIDFILSDVDLSEEDKAKGVSMSRADMIEFIIKKEMKVNHIVHKYKEKDYTDNKKGKYEDKKGYVKPDELVPSTPILPTFNIDLPSMEEVHVIADIIHAYIDNPSDVPMDELEKMNDIKITGNIFEYLYVPIVVYIMRKYIEDLERLEVRDTYIK